VNCLSKQTWDGWLSLWWFWTKNLSTQTGEGKSCVPAKDEHQGCFYRGGRPAWADHPGWLPCSPGSAFLQHDDLPFVTFVLACSTSCTAQTLSFTPLLALLVVPLDAFALSHVHAPLLHMPPCLLHPHACPLHVVLMKVVERASNDASWCMHNLLNKIASL
jgi:hypothetical protein